MDEIAMFVARVMLTGNGEDVILANRAARDALARARLRRNPNALTECDCDPEDPCSVCRRDPLIEKDTEIGEEEEEC